MLWRTGDDSLRHIATSAKSFRGNVDPVTREPNRIVRRQSRHAFRRELANLTDRTAALW
ncbi:MAG: hypothetical protein AAGC53_05715 [Actinomycetota bacterium]